MFKDPYLFDFLGTDMLSREVELERQLTEHIHSFYCSLDRDFIMHFIKHLYSREIDDTVLSSLEKAIFESVVKNICCYCGKVLEKYSMINPNDIKEYTQTMFQQI